MTSPGVRWSRIPLFSVSCVVTDSTIPPFRNKTYSTLRSYPYKILHSIMVLIRWKWLGPCKGIQREVQEYFKTIDNGNTLWIGLAKIHWKSFTKGRPFQARWLKALACDTVHPLHVEMCRKAVASLIPPNLYPKSLPDKFNLMRIKPSKDFWNKVKIPRDDFSSGLEFLTKFNQNKQIS